MSIVTASANHQLDQLLELMTEILQLSGTQYALAEQRYGAVSDWLSRDGSPLAAYDPLIHPQGSMLLGTTVRPRGLAVYDLDLVCLMDLRGGALPDPMRLYDQVYARLADSEVYAPLLRRKNRCLRLDYVNDFHLDILPAVADPARGGTCILVPDRKLKDWKESNPKGFAEWFERQARPWRRVLAEREIEPLPAPQAAQQKATLKRVVQLIKRYRDIACDGDQWCARSVVLTTLAATNFAGDVLCSDGLLHVVGAIVDWTEAQPGVPVVANPTNDAENFAESWNAESYRAFVSLLGKFREELHELTNSTGLEDVASGLSRLFGEDLSNRVIAESARRIKEANDAGAIRMHKGGGLTTGGMGAVASSSSSSSFATRGHTFYGA